MHFKRWIRVPFLARVSECLHAERWSTWHLAAMLLWAHLILHKACGNQNVPVTGVNLCLTGTDLESGHNLLFLVANISLWPFVCRWAGASPLHANVSLYIPCFLSALWLYDGNSWETVTGSKSCFKTTWSMLGNGTDFFWPIGYQCKSYNIYTIN